MAIQTGATSYDQEMADLQKKQQLAQALMQASLSDKPSGEMVSGHYISHGMSNAVSDLVNAYLSKNLGDKTQASMQDLAGRKSSALQEALSNYMDTKNGKEASTQPYSEDQIRSLMLDDKNLPDQVTTPAMAPNPREAAVKALASQFPQLQTLGAMDLTALNKAPVQEEWANPVELNLDGKPSMVQFGKHGGQRQVQGASPVEKKPLVQLSLDQRVQENANKKLGEASIDEIVKGKADAQKAQSSYEYLQALKPSLDQALTGFGADPKLAMMKIYTALGGTDDGTITSSEQLASALAQKVLDNSKTLGSGSGFTDTDRTYLEKVVQGKLALDPATIRHALNAGIADAWNKMNQHQRLLGQLANNATLGFSKDTLQPFQASVPDLETVNPNGDARDFTFDPQTQRLIANPFPMTMKPGVGTPKEIQKTPKIMSAEEYLKSKGF